MAGEEHRTSTFQPGNKSYCWFQGDKLNGNVHWQQEVETLLKQTPLTKNSLSQCLNREATLIDEILQRDYTHLDFKTGAKIIAQRIKYEVD